MKETYLKGVTQIIRMGHWITDQISLELKEFDITEPQYNVLRTLSDANGKPVTVQDLLDSMMQRSSNITRIVDKLIAKGLVIRQECPTNRRKMDITITSEGKRLLKKLDKKVYSFHQPMEDNLNNKELETLNKLIKKLKGDKND